MAWLERVSHVTFAELSRWFDRPEPQVRKVVARVGAPIVHLRGTELVPAEELLDRLGPVLSEFLRRRLADDGLRAVAPERTVAGVPVLLHHYDLARNEVPPWRIPPVSTRKVWFRCPEGPDHVFRRELSVSREKGRWVGCPFCDGRRVSVTNCLATIAPKVAAQWHPTRNRPLTPKTIQAYSSRVVWWQCTKVKQHVFQARVGARTRIPGAATGNCSLCDLRRLSSATSLRRRAPALAREWHPTKNGRLTPDDLTPGSATPVWWRCPVARDHVWRTAPRNRRRNGCPYCSGRKASSTDNLARSHPALAREWHPTRNGKLTPRDVTSGSGKQATWRCRRDPAHVWRTMISARAGGRLRPASQCPYCVGRRRSASTSLAARAPWLAAEWHPTKNGRLRPEDCVVRDRRRVTWLCKRGHVFETEVRSRYIGRTGCPYCAGNRV